MGREECPVVLGFPGDPFGDGVHEQVRAGWCVAVAGVDLAPDQPGGVRLRLNDADACEHVPHKGFAVGLVVDEGLARPLP